MEEIYGHIERITFQSAENGFTVARLKEPRKPDLTTVVGTLSSVQVGETVRCKGQWHNDVNYGFQFKVESYQVEQPSTIYGIKKYLGSGMIKGIGSAFAERIVEYHGANTLDVIDENPEALLEVDGIGPKRLDSIKKCWDEQKAIREVMVFLQSYGISPTYAQKVFKTYGDQSIAVIEENPYQLARDIWGIGFKTADNTARKMGIEKDAPQRIEAGIEYVLNELSNDGHTCYPVDLFLEKSQDLLEVESELVANRMEAIAAEDRVIIAPLEWEGTLTACIWLQLFHLCEKGIVKELQRLQKGSSTLRKVEVTKATAWAESKLNIQLANNQRLAVENSLNDKIHIITGGPGTGKSTITKVILLVLKQLTEKILLAAPTGRAAKRMSEITKKEASTIHSLLEYDFSIGGFKRNRDNPLDCEVLIVDEASMIDTVLMYSLLKALPDETKLIIVGDIDQLPSVGAGNVLQDFIASEKVSTTKLTEIFRQAASSQIIVNAHRINAGLFPTLENQHQGDFFFIERPDALQIIDLIPVLVQSRLPKKYKFDAFDDIQVLSPMNRGIIGTRNLNEILQKQLNPSNDPLIKAGRTFHLNDKVMQIRNNYDKDVYNGDVGRITEINQLDQELSVRFDNRLVSYDFTDIDQLTLAYAVTIHKYQGSECPCILMPIHQTHYMMLYRNLLYTGITRGKKLVILIGTKRAIDMSVRNNRVAARYTGLKQRLMEG